MKRLVLIPLSLFFIATTFSIAYAEDSTTVAAEGTATQPDIDMKGSDITNIGSLDADTISGGSVSGTTVQGTNVTATSKVTAPAVVGTTVTGTTVKGTTVTATSGQITTLDTNRTYVRQTATAGVDATNKSYVDGKDAALSSSISSLTSRVSALEGNPGSTFQQIALVDHSHYNSYSFEWVINGVTKYKPLYITANITIIHLNNWVGPTFFSGGAPQVSGGNCLMGSDNGRSAYIMIYPTSTTVRVSSLAKYVTNRYIAYQ